MDTLSGGYHLAVGSPCIDAGDPELPYDPDTTISDMGAFYNHQVAIEESDAILSFAYALHPNRPNPFNPTTNICYDGAQTNHITLTIYNLSSANKSHASWTSSICRVLIQYSGTPSTSPPGSISAA